MHGFQIYSLQMFYLKDTKMLHFSLFSKLMNHVEIFVQLIVVTANIPWIFVLNICPNIDT